MKRFGTRAVRGDGEPASTPEPHISPLHQTTAFSFPTAREAIEALAGSGYSYSRKANPTVRELERHIAALEKSPVETEGETLQAPGDTDARFFGSGMAAISGVILGVAAGRRLVCQAGIYGTTEAMVGRLPGYGVQVDFVPVGDLEALAEEVGRGEPPALVHIESPANPLLQLTDVRRASEIAHEAGAYLSIDATFATPALIRPLVWGADLVLHSTTKFMSGYGVALGGVVSGSVELLARAIDPVRLNFGGIADPFGAWLTRLGLRTLDVRMDRHVANAEALVEFLASHPRIARVFYPDPSELPAGQLASGGPMLSFEVEGGEKAALTVIDELSLITLAPTLGTVDTLVQHPYSMSHGVLPEARRREMGIDPGILRLSVGLEDRSDLLEDLSGALSS
jgi:methionine-gamma-lyase